MVGFARMETYSDVRFSSWKANDIGTEWAESAGVFGVSKDIPHPALGVAVSFVRDKRGAGIF